MKSAEEINRWFPIDSHIVSIHIDYDQWTLQYNLMLVLTDVDVAMEELGSDPQRPITLYFWNVSHLKLEPFVGGLHQFSHLQVSRTYAGYDGINYFLEEMEGGKISFNFSSVDNLSE